MMEKYSQRGSALLYMMILVWFISSLIMISLLRAQFGIQHVRSRYLLGVARDLAENEIEAQKLLLSQGQIAKRETPNNQPVGVFAGCAGFSESYSQLLPGGGHEIVSQGDLVERGGKLVYSVQVRAQVKRGANGGWTVVKWSEQRLQ